MNDLLSNIDIEELEKQLNTLIEVQSRFKEDIVFIHEHNLVSGIETEDQELEFLENSVENLEGLINFIGHIIFPNT